MTMLAMGVPRDDQRTKFARSAREVQMHLNSSHWDRVASVRSAPTCFLKPISHGPLKNRANRSRSFGPAGRTIALPDLCLPRGEAGRIRKVRRYHDDDASRIGGIDDIGSNPR
jgi:hypothetical protein